MIKSGAVLSLVVSSLVFAYTAQAQHITGSTILDVSGTGTVTATCETDLDAEAQGYYEAVVHCAVVDGYGNQVAYGQYIDHYGNQGYAQAVVTFTKAFTTIRDGITLPFFRSSTVRG